MKTGKQSRHVTPAGANIFSDLGYEPTTAAALDAESRRIIATKLALRLSLLKELNAWINEEELRADEAARVLCTSSSRVTDIFRLQAERFTIDELTNMLCRAKRQVVVSIGP